MAYECESKQTVVDIIKLTDFTEVRVSKLENENGELEAIDVRQWYCTQKNPEYTPTQKGIRIKEEFVDQLLSAIKKCRE